MWLPPILLWLPPFPNCLIQLGKFCNFHSIHGNAYSQCQETLSLPLPMYQKFKCGNSAEFHAGRRFSPTSRHVTKAPHHWTLVAETVFNHIGCVFPTSWHKGPHKTSRKNLLDLRYVGSRPQLSLPWFNSIYKLPDVGKRYFAAILGDILSGQWP